MMVRPIRRVFIHHSAGPRDQTFEAIAAYHRLPKKKGGKGYAQIGYHYVVLGDGTLRNGRPVQIQGAHALGHNADSIGVCLVGDNRDPAQAWTAAQLATARTLVATLRCIWPALAVHGHRDFVVTECPSLDVRTLGL